MLLIRRAAVGALALLSTQVMAREDLYGVIDKRPDAKVGTWVVGGKDVVVDDKVRIKEERGPAKVGACVKLDYETRKGVLYLEKIETERAAKCEKK